MRTKRFIKGIPILVGFVLIVVLLGGGYTELRKAYVEIKINTQIGSINTHDVQALLDLLRTGRDHDRCTAEIGFQSLGTKARFAAPLLIELTQRGKSWITRFGALRCLIATQPPKQMLTSTLVTMMRDPVKGLGSYAAGLLINTDRERAQREGVFNAFPEFGLMSETNSYEMPAPNSPLF